MKATKFAFWASWVVFCQKNTKRFKKATPMVAFIYILLRNNRHDHIPSLIDDAHSLSDNVHSLNDYVHSLNDYVQSK